MTTAAVTAIRIDPDREPFLDEIRAHCETVDRVAHCMQCGTCTGGCPTASIMEFTPRQMMYMVQLSMKEELLASRSIWNCVNCYTCSIRCPRDIKVSEILDALRAMALKAKAIPRTESVYHHSFTKVMERYGRVFEGELMMRFSLLCDPFKLMKESTLGLKMFRKGKLHMMPHRVQGLDKLNAPFHE
jgi:heterodisulfide reductase subunit C